METKYPRKLNFRSLPVSEGPKEESAPKLSDFHSIDKCNFKCLCSEVCTCSYGGWCYEYD